MGIEGPCWGEIRAVCLNVDHLKIFDKIILSFLSMSYGCFIFAKCIGGILKRIFFAAGLSIISGMVIGDQHPPKQLFEELETKGTLSCYAENEPDVPQLVFNFADKKVTDKTFFGEPTMDMDKIACRKTRYAKAPSCTVSSHFEDEFGIMYFLSYEFERKYGKLSLTFYSVAELELITNLDSAITKSYGDENAGGHYYQAQGEYLKLIDAAQFNGSTLKMICN